MKKFTLICFAIVLSTTVNAQQSIVWEPEVTVADGSIYGSVRPRIAITADNIPVVLFGDAVDGNLFVARYNGTAFNTPVDIVMNGMETYLANWTGPDIAAKGDTVIAVFKANPVDTGYIYAVRSTDGGITFSSEIRVDNHDIGQAWMPALDIDENGNPHVTYMIFNALGVDERIAVAASTDAGLTYEPQQVVTATTPGVACDCCPPEIVVNGNYELALFRNNDANLRDSYGSLSEDFGASYTSSADLDNLGWIATSCPSTGPSGVIIGDSAYVVSASRASGKYRVYASSVGLLGGLNLENVQMMDPPTTSTGDTQNHPRISGGGDTLVVVWEETQTGNTDIMYSVTSDGSVQSLDDYKFVATESSTGLQSKPDVIYKDGFVHLVYQDYHAGNVVYKRGTIVDGVGIDPISATKIEVYPNPNTGSFSLSGLNVDELQSISITNLLGESVPFTLSNGNGGIEIVLIEKISGVYTVQMVGANGELFAERIVVR